MKQLKCEMCGSTELIKQDGVFVCQSCGCKYSVEEAKKMMVEGVVEIDESSKIDNYLQLAKNAYVATNYSEAEMYCNKILEITADHSDALFLKGVASAWQSTLARPRMEEFDTGYSNAINCENDPDKLWELGCKAYEECYSLHLSMINLKLNHLVEFPSEEGCIEVQNYLKTLIFAPLQIQLVYGQKFNQWKIGKPEYENQTPKSIADNFEYDDLLLLAKEEIHASALKIWNNVISEYNKEAHPTTYEYDRVTEDGIVAVVLMDFAVPKDFSRIDKFSAKERDLTIQASTDLINMYTTLSNLKAYEVDFSGGFESYKVVKSPNKDIFVQEIKKYHTVLNKFDPSHVVPDIPVQASSTSGCYVATCVYGSYDCPQVWTLRRFRDNTLAETLLGRAFIRTYYAISPTLVKLFGDTTWFKKMWRGTLDRMVSRLHDNGIENTPYEDKNW